MTVYRCATCGQHIEWLRTGLGRRLPFNLDPVPVNDVEPGEGWVTEVRMIRGRRLVVLVRYSSVSVRKQEAVRHVVLLHDQCPQFKNHIDTVMNPPEGLEVSTRQSDPNRT